jgi:hypothetical protein
MATARQSAEVPVKDHEQPGPSVIGKAMNPPEGILQRKGHRRLIYTIHSSMPPFRITSIFNLQPSAFNLQPHQPKKK